MLALLLACAPVEMPTDAASSRDTGTRRDTATHDTTSDTAAHDTASDDGLVGDPIDPPLDPPDFLVENQYGDPRTPDWLASDPTVLWFFRDAGST